MILNFVLGALMLIVPPVVGWVIWMAIKATMTDLRAAAARRRKEGR